MKPLFVGKIHTTMQAVACGLGFIGWAFEGSFVPVLQIALVTGLLFTTCCSFTGYLIKGLRVLSNRPLS
jgi:phosphatidylglycerophosphate synthase